METPREAATALVARGGAAARARGPTPRAKDAASVRRARFFDDTAASVHRLCDLVPYREYRDA